jgi:hypothetical protein
VVPIDVFLFFEAKENNIKKKERGTETGGT